MERQIADEGPDRGYIICKWRRTSLVQSTGWPSIITEMVMARITLVKSNERQMTKLGCEYALAHVDGNVNWRWPRPRAVTVETRSKSKHARRLARATKYRRPSPGTQRKGKASSRCLIRD
ncbi:hypothetical protein CTRI78_v003503 [Colletotrichum trifolii]|uniref:Uncharacterized protein n=1 Tax=Colletotrichum trifolii TaxID=5466 RepID=A0A4V3HWS2_COLTR|nr:hypothetical protein CTRI78_v003503 [Colletotrichum trifolii]